MNGEYDCMDCHRSMDVEQVSDGVTAAVRFCPFCGSEAVVENDPDDELR